MAIGIFESFITRHWFSAAGKDVWADTATLQAWLDVEAALAQAQAQAGMIPASAAAVITARARAELFDPHQLADAIAFAQHPLVPVLHQLELLCGEPAAGFIHWGATTQNIFDTATALQMRTTHALLRQHLDASIDQLSVLVSTHEATPMAGRTHGQHALPMTLGFKLAGWIDELARTRKRLDERFAACFPASMGGAIGTYAAMGPLGPKVQQLVAELLGLNSAELPIRSSGDRLADFAATLGLLAGTVQKIAQDVVFMQRTEIGELEEAFHMGKVGSSTMAQKRNPSTALLLISMSRMLRNRSQLVTESMVRMDEGDSSASNVTDAVVPEVAILAVSITETLARLTAGLVVKEEALQRNLQFSGGLIASEAVMMLLTQQMGRHEAHRLVYEAAQCAQSAGLPFVEALRALPSLNDPSVAEALAQALDTNRYLGESVALSRHTVLRIAPPRTPQADE